MAIHQLTPAEIKHAIAPKHYVDGGGLYLQVSELGGRNWVFKFTSPVTRKVREMGLGPLRDISVTAAREKAAELRLVVRDLRDPIDERDAKKAALKAAKSAEAIAALQTITFEECANKYVENQIAKKAWKNAKHAAQWQSTLELYAYPVIGSFSVAAIDTGLVLKALDPIWTEKTETASRLRGRIQTILDYATFRGFRPNDANPARWKGHLDNELTARNKRLTTKSFKSLPYVGVGAFMAELQKREGNSIRALQFAVLTAARSGEVRGMAWDEIGTVDSLPVWTIPAHRMKKQREHRVPLSAQAVALLESMPRIDGTNLVFPAPKKGPLSDMALTAVLRRMAEEKLIEPGITQHGMRGTFKTWASEVTRAEQIVIEHALAHQLKDASEATYLHGDLLEKRFHLMSQWSGYCDEVRKPDNVVRLEQAVAA